MRTVTVTVTCDWCRGRMDVDLGTPPLPITVGKTAYQADLCEECLGKFTSVVTGFARARGTKPTEKVPTACSECGKVFPTKQGAATHRARVHGLYATKKKAAS